MIDGVADGTGAVIGAFYAVCNTLRYGFLESVYSSALEMECREREINLIREMPLVVEYKGRAIGSYRAVFFVNGLASGCTLDRRPSSIAWSVRARSDSPHSRGFAMPTINAGHQTSNDPQLPPPTAKEHRAHHSQQRKRQRGGQEDSLWPKPKGVSQ